MPIYRGDRKIAKVYRGTREIKSIYRGTQQVFSSGTPIHLFGDVYKAKWVKINDEASSPQELLYFLATNDFDQYQRKYECYYKGVFPSPIWVQTLSKSHISKDSIRLGGVSNAVSLPESDNITKVLVDKTSLYINDNFVSLLAIGETLDSGTTQRIRLTKTYSFYELKIYDNDVLVYHFVPAYQKVGSTIQYGIAELVNQSFTYTTNIIGEPEYE